MFKERSCSIINDGKVVMVHLCVVDSQTGENYREVGRATCNLDCDKFDFKTGLKIAKGRAMEKIAKKVLKDCAFMSKTLRKSLEEVNEYMDRLQSIIDSQLEVIER